MIKRGEIIKQSVMTAGEAVRKATPTQGVVEKEGRANIVTAADLASEKAIMDLIRTHFPEDAILSEETTSEIKNPLEAERLWVLDPIDGTNNFRYERSYSAVSVGYVERGIIKMGAAYDPFRNELFYAEQGKGAYLNGKRIHVGDQEDLAKASVATDNSYDPEGTRHNLELALRLPSTPWMLMKGSAVLTMCEVAAARIDLYYHTVLKPWDNAAAFLIAQEAGAVVKGFDGNDINFLSPNVIMGNECLVRQFLEAIK